uniref:Inactive rhomboid protein 1 n=1 Tax=Lygus hesperus TaxID=30085 RepID=A0A0A9XV04_LYGHE
MPRLDGVAIAHAIAIHLQIPRSSSSPARVTSLTTLPFVDCSTNSLPSMQSSSTPAAAAARYVHSSPAATHTARFAVESLAVGSVACSALPSHSPPHALYLAQYVQ